MRKIFITVIIMFANFGISFSQVTKSGEPDKRFKANKIEITSETKLKADGTPDMRYKSNQEAAKKLNKKANASSNKTKPKKEKAKPQISKKEPEKEN